MASRKSNKVNTKTAIRTAAQTLAKASVKTAAKPIAKPASKLLARAAMTISDSSWGTAGQHGDIRYGATKPGPRLVPRD
jgi:hypothetical protein